MRLKYWGVFIALAVVVVGILAVGFFKGFSLTGMVIFETGDEPGFDEGTYSNTSFNGSAVVLDGENLSGVYLSKVFDATADAVWNNLSWAGSEPNVEFLFGVDGGGDVYSSPDLAVNWVLKKEDYGRTSDTEYMFSDSDYLYIISNSNKEVWKSGEGVSWSVINDSFADSGLLVGDVGAGENLFVVDASGDVYMSSDQGATWSLQGDFNGGASNNAKGIGIDSGGDIFIVDGGGIVWKSTNNGVDWTEQSSGYGGGAGTDDLKVDGSGNLYILLNKDVYKSTDDGVSWDVINDSFTSYSNDGVRMFIDDSDNFFIADGSGRIHKSTDLGVSWFEQGDLNGGASNNPKGLTDFSRTTNLTFQVRNCSLSDCSDASFSSADLTDLNLGGQYFQYKVEFTSPDSSETPSLESVTVDYDLSNSAPTVSIVSPSDGSSYGISQTISLNYSVSDADGNLDSCWYNLNSGENTSLASCANSTLSGLDVGSFTLNLFVNDTQGGEGTDSVGFTVTNSAPILTLVEPQDGATYGTNESLDLEYSVSDSDGNLDSCWYTLDSGENNVSLADCANTTFDVSEGSITLAIYANDTDGEEASDSASFSVDVGAPTITLTSPIDVYLSSEDVMFRYTPTDIDLDSCELWGNFTGTFEFNQTDASPTSGSENTFSLILRDGGYLWNIKCNDSSGNEATSGNKTFYVDTVNPDVTLTQPSGTKTSRTGIPLTFAVSDNSPVSCVYNVYQGASVEVANTSINCSLGSGSFAVSADASFVLNFFVNDSAGNVNDTNSSFSVDTSTTPPVVNPPSGGGGSSSSVPKDYNESSEIKVEFLDVGQIILKRGTGTKADLTATNKEKIFLNNCKLLFEGLSKDWLQSSQAKGLSPGEKFSFDVVITVPEEVEPGRYGTTARLQCDEGRAETVFDIVAYRNIFDIEILDYEKIGNKLKVLYNLKEYGGESHEIVLEYALVDFDGVSRYIGEEAVSLGAKDSTEKFVEFDLPKDSFGEFVFKMKLSDGLSKIATEKEIFLPSEGGLTGLAISEDNRIRLTVFGIVVGLLIIGIFVVYFVRKFRKKK
ncbi:MAG: hypothetical protein KJ600_01025 [Nanoarchaeota archaeon]|nr:hypothetical protein [Nanoarchaeota archaeon]MBU1103124.1 hypothetical protein [Nanoarchaeota archaeon]